MSVTVEFLPGPSTAEVSRQKAEEGLRRNAAVVAGAAYALEQFEGRWVAAIVHEAAPPFGGPPAPGGPPGGGPADASEEAPGPKSEGPDDQEPSADEGGAPEGLGGEPDGDEGGDKKDKKGGEGHELHQVLDALTQIAEALGVPLGLGDSPVPGADGLDAPAGPAGPPVPGAGGPPPGHPGAPGAPGGAAGAHGADQAIMHMKALKPGEVPPGATPASAPAFSSVREDHPWGHIAGQVASFQVDSEIGDTPLADVESELQALASEVGYKVTRFGEGRNDEGQRVASAVISKH